MRAETVCGAIYVSHWSAAQIGALSLVDSSCNGELSLVEDFILASHWSFALLRNECNSQVSIAPFSFLFASRYNTTLSMLSPSFSSTTPRTSYHSMSSRWTRGSRTWRGTAGLNPVPRMPMHCLVWGQGRGLDCSDLMAVCGGVNIAHSLES